MTDTTPDPQEPQQPAQQPGAQPPPQQPAGPYPPAPVSPADERTWSILAHAGGIVLGFIAPLIIWLIFRERSQRLDDQGKEALNFQLTLLIAHVVGWVTIWIFIGSLILFAAWACAVIFGILGAVAASRDEWYRYPFKITFVK
ncbi:DUF4870 domain-containing protein [Isoptericola halotolerans]|uniref:DUF4870 domain-containing protein n=1 Tax=Isoptericola halotolerans TaxID=300560 RepID=A0ABX2A809_9MICO|nr:DUF4870 domain-containing protein [Isoptericola halotolerans]NOV99010.1 hypothetical protein [Isoptericola halotolerans]